MATATERRVGTGDRRRAGVSGPVAGTRITEAYARMAAREIYFWAWPMANVYNRRIGFAQLKEPGRLGGALPEIKRFSVGTKNKDLKPGPDGSLTIYVQADPPGDADQRANWLPAPKSGEFSLYLRTYWPQDAILGGQWSPPAVQPA